jgi:hypothetical protein
VIESQIEKECTARDATLERYLAIVRRMENYFKGFTVEYVERIKTQKQGYNRMCSSKPSKTPP